MLGKSGCEIIIAFITWAKYLMQEMNRTTLVEKWYDLKRGARSAFKDV